MASLIESNNKEEAEGKKVNYAYVVKQHDVSVDQLRRRMKGVESKLGREPVNR